MKDPTVNAKSTIIRIKSPWRRIFCLSVFVAAVVVAIAAIGSPDLVAGGGFSVLTATASKVAPWVMEHTANGQQAEFFVVLADQTDLGYAASLQTKAEKGRYVYNTLLNKAQITQGPILQWYASARFSTAHSISLT